MNDLLFKSMMIALTCRFVVYFVTVPSKTLMLESLIHQEGDNDCYGSVKIENRSGSPYGRN